MSELARQLVGYRPTGMESNYVSPDKAARNRAGLAGVLSTFADYVKVPGRVLYQDPTLTDAELGAFLRDTIMGGVGLGSARQMAGRTSAAELGIFGGRRGAKNLDDFEGSERRMSALDEAKLRRAKGESPAEVWRDTGWGFDTTDGMWKFEIDDSPARFTATDQPSWNDNVYGGEKAALLGGPARLPNILGHPELYRAYPQLVETRAAAAVRRDKRQGGSYSPDDEQISVNFQLHNPLGALDTALHEANHAVQHLENFGKGGNRTVAGDVATLYDDIVAAATWRREVANHGGDEAAARAAYEGQVAGDRLPSQRALRMARDDMVEDAELAVAESWLSQPGNVALVQGLRAAPPGSPERDNILRSIYRDLHGERASYDVGARMFLDSKQRREMPPRFLTDPGGLVTAENVYPHNEVRMWEKLLERNY